MTLCRGVSSDPGALLGQSWGSLGRFWGLPGGLLRPLGASRGPLEGLLGRRTKPDIATNPDLEMQVGMIGESGTGKEGGACWGLD